MSTHVSVRARANGPGAPAGLRGHRSAVSAGPTAERRQLPRRAAVAAGATAPPSPAAEALKAASSATVDAGQATAEAAARAGKRRSAVSRAPPSRSSAPESAASKSAAEARAFRRSLGKSGRYTKRLTDAPPALAAMEEHGVGYSATGLVARMRTSGNRWREGQTEVVLAQSYGFCWGVERAVQMAYEARERHPDRTVHITNEIIHNPSVNGRLREMGVRFVEATPTSPGSPTLTKDFSGVGDGDIVILPAFGASVEEMRLLHDRGALIVDTTCPWVSKVWNAVDNQARRGHTSIIHGKWAHEETLATASFAGGYLVVKDLIQAQRLVDEYMSPDAQLALRVAAADDATAVPGAPTDPVAAAALRERGLALRARFFAEYEHAHSEGLEPCRDLDRIGMANQTTMLKGETYAIGKLLESTQMRRFGPETLGQHYMVMDTICDATQERQDAVTDLVGGQEDPERRIDALVVVGGFNSSNTSHLQEIGEFAGIPSFWVDSAERIRVDENALDHKTAHGELVTTVGWLPTDPAIPMRVGVTSGASTPDRAVEDVLDKIFSIRDPSFSGVSPLAHRVGKPKHADAA